MKPSELAVLEARQLPELYRSVCLYAGVAPPSAPSPQERFVFRSGAEPPELLSRLLEEALASDRAEIPPCGPADEHHPGPHRVEVRPGFGGPCPAEAELRRAARPGGGGVLVFAVERHDTSGRLLGVTWGAIAEEEPPPQSPFRAAVVRYDSAEEPPARKSPAIPDRRRKTCSARWTFPD